MLSVSTQIARGEDLASFAEMLASVAFADELIVFNMERTDQEVITLCKKYHAKIVEVKTPKVVEVIRSRQIREVKGDWVLIMDYDEIIPVVLQKEIMHIVRELQSVSAFMIGRENYSLGYPLRHGGWNSDDVVRLIHRVDFLDWPTNIHSTPSVQGKMGRTKHMMEHHKDHSLTEMVEKTNRYSAIEAEQFFSGNLPLVTSPTLIRKWWMESFRRGISKGGLSDGVIGLIQSLYQGFSVFISYAKLYEKQQGEK